MKCTKGKLESIKKYVGIIFLTAMVLSLFSTLESNASDVSQQQKIEFLPEMTAMLTLNGSQFEQHIQLVLPNSVSIQKLRELATNGSLMRELSTWVTGAEFKLPTISKNPSGYNIEYWLTIGKYGFDYTQVFGCHEQLAEGVMWSQMCEQYSNYPEKKGILQNGKRDFACHVENGAQDKSVVCDFVFSGTIENLSIAFQKISGQKIANILFLEHATYLANLGLLLTHAASNTAQSKSMFNSSKYAFMIQTLKNKSAELNIGISADAPLRCMPNAPESCSIQASTKSSVKVSSL